MESLPSLSIPPPPKKTKSISVIVIVALLLVGLVTGSLIGYAITYSDFNEKISNLSSQIGIYQGFSNNGSQQIYLLNDNVSLSSLYQEVKSSVSSCSRSCSSIRIFWRPFRLQSTARIRIHNPSKQSIRNRYQQPCCARRHKRNCYVCKRKLLSSKSTGFRC